MQVHIVDNSLLLVVGDCDRTPAHIINTQEEYIILQIAYKMRCNYDELIYLYNQLVLELSITKQEYDFFYIGEVV